MYGWLVGLFNPSNTDDECTHHGTLATPYQLAQPILKVGFVLAKRWDRGRWVGHVMEMVAVLDSCRRA